MTRLGIVPTSAWNLIKQSFKQYPLLMIKLLPFTFVLAALRIATPFLFTKSAPIAWTSLAIFLVLTWYLYAVSVYMGNRLLQVQEMSYLSALYAVGKRLVAIIFGNLVLMAIFAAVILVEIKLLNIFVGDKLTQLHILIVFAIDLLLFIYIYFAMALIVLDNITPLYAFEESFRLVKGRWFHSLITLLAVIMLALILFLATRLLTLLSTTWIVLSFNFIYELLFYPLLISTTLVLLHDLKLRANKI